MVEEDRDQLTEYIYYYKMTENRLRNLNDYANSKYAEIQNNIFKNGGDNYFSILSSSWLRCISSCCWRNANSSSLPFLATASSSS